MLRLLTITEARKVHKIPRGTLKSAIHRRELEAMKDGSGIWRMTDDAIKRWKRRPKYQAHRKPKAYMKGNKFAVGSGGGGAREGAGRPRKEDIQIIDGQKVRKLRRKPGPPKQVPGMPKGYRSPLD